MKTHRLSPIEAWLDDNPADYEQIESLVKNMHHDTEPLHQILETVADYVSDEMKQTIGVNLVRPVVQKILYNLRG